jgi:pyridoxamine 5'-phosphate oxidase
MLAEPIEQFRRWFDEAVAAGQAEPEAMAVATAAADGRPSVRYVLLRGVDERGFVFFTNGRSRKGAEMEANPRAALAFRWEVTQRQVRVGGPVAPIPPSESDGYFSARPRLSQLSAWASDQSRPVSGREELDQRMAEFSSRYEGADVPRPPWWGGYRVEPAEVEFWQQGPFRMHDRLVYERAGGDWTLRRLFP